MNATIQFLICFVLSTSVANCHREPQVQPLCQNGVDCAWSSLAHSDSLGCATWSDGTMACWGRFSYDGQVVEYGVNPLRLAMDVGVQKVAVSSDGICTIGLDMSVWCWGDNSLGIVGDGSVDFKAEPQKVDGVSDARDICIGYTQSCAVLLDGSVLCWGKGEYLNEPPRTPDVLAIPEAAVDISCAANHFCSRTVSGTVVCWGVLPLSGYMEWSSPVEIAGLQEVKRLSAGHKHACVITEAGVALCWGRNASGELGDGTTYDATQPVAVDGDHVFSEISAGYSNTCAVDEMGIGWCWGRGSNGTLGNGSPHTHSMPVKVSNLSGIVGIHSHGKTTFAVLQDGSIWGWGAAQYLAYQEINLIRDNSYDYVEEPTLLRDPFAM